MLPEGELELDSSMAGNLKTLPSARPLLEPPLFTASFLGVSVSVEYASKFGLEMRHFGLVSWSNGF